MSDKEETKTENKMYKFSEKELDIICLSLINAINTNREYLHWKKDDFSQKVIPEEINKQTDLLIKVYDLLRQKSLKTNNSHRIDYKEKAKELLDDFKEKSLALRVVQEIEKGLTDYGIETDQIKNMGYLWSYYDGVKREIINP
jgi:hypothetical protein